MTIQKISYGKNINFKEQEETANTANSIKSDLVKSPIEDNFEKEENTETIVQPKKKYSIKNICLGILSTIVLAYGSAVLWRKLSKPNFEEVQKCFKEIFNKDLSTEQVKDLINKYKEICKNKNTDDFTKKIIEQLKKDYGIEQVKTELNIKKPADRKNSTKLERRERGNASPLAEINIMPATNSNHILRSIQGETFTTGFHEMKHITQFSEAYRANPDKFAEAMFKRNVKPKELDSKIQENIKSAEKAWRQYAERLKNGDDELISRQYEGWKEANPEQTITKNQYKQEIMNEDIDNLIMQLKTFEGAETEEKLYELIKKSTKEMSIKSYRERLDERYGKLTLYKEGTPEYKRGMEYIEAYEKYPDPKQDYDAYKKNLLEKEAWHIGDLARKIYKYTSSIWKL